MQTAASALLFTLKGKVVVKRLKSQFQVLCDTGKSRNLLPTLKKLLYKAVKRPSKTPQGQIAQWSKVGEAQGRGNFSEGE